VHLSTVVLKDEELARDLECGKKQLLLTVVRFVSDIAIFVLKRDVKLQLTLTVVRLILTWLRQLSNWCRLVG